MSAPTSSPATRAPLLSIPAELSLQCPQCGVYLGRLRDDEFPPEFLYSCLACRFQMLNDEGIWRALPPARLARFARFMHEYQAVREAEGRGSERAEYYFALPYHDLSGHNAAQWAIRARTYRHIETILLPALEARKPRSMAILDLGAGNGWMSYRLAQRQHRPVAVDLIASERDGLAAAIHFQLGMRTLFPRFQAELDRLPFTDSQFDLAIFNASFHYSEDYAETLGEAIRCLRPGGTVMIADTAWYSCEQSGQQMLAERREAFTLRYGFPSDSIASLEFLTDARLSALADQFGLRWQVHTPSYGLSWAMRPFVARLKGKREPSHFRIYLAEVAK